MTGTGLPELAAAVSRAGGLGIVAIHNFGTTEEACRAGIRKTRELCEGKPFGVNLTILPVIGEVNSVGFGFFSIFGINLYNSAFLRDKT